MDNSDEACPVRGDGRGRGSWKKSGTTNNVPRNAAVPAAIAVLVERTSRLPSRRSRNSGAWVRSSTWTSSVRIAVPAATLPMICAWVGLEAGAGPDGVLVVDQQQAVVGVGGVMGL